MFDEDEMGSITLSLSRPFVPDDQIEEAMAEAKALDLPFDLSYVTDYNPFVYGPLGMRGKIGRWVYFKGHEVVNLNGDRVYCEPGVALIVGDAFGRYVLGFENERTGWVYLGWVLLESFDFLDIHYENSSWMH
jgi:hypothetical protein